MANVYATLTVDWDGWELDQDAIDAMVAFNRAFPGYPITHFICPSYLTRTIDPVVNGQLVALMNKAIKDIDEVTLHIHCWYSLLTAANVLEYVKVPTYYPHDGEGPTTPWGTETDAGHGVPLGWYDVAQIRQILQAGRLLLQLNHVKNTDLSGAFKSFRCGGWLASDKVLQAVSAENYLYEASGAPARYFRMVVQDEPDSLPLAQWVPLIWGDHMVNLPSYLTNTWRQLFYPAGIAGLYPQEVTTTPSAPARMNQLIQIPDTGALADYVDQAYLQTYIDAAVQAATTNGKDVFISMGWHEESATGDSPWHPGIANLQVIWNILDNNASRLHFLTVSAAGQLWNALPPLPAIPPLLPSVVPEKRAPIPVTKHGLILG